MLLFNHQLKSDGLLSPERNLGSPKKVANGGICETK